MNRKNKGIKSRSADFGNYNFSRIRKSLVVESLPTKKPKISLLLVFSVVMSLIAMLALFTITKPLLTGFVAAEKELSFNDTISIGFTSNSEYEWQIINPGDVKSIRLNGQVEDSTIARVYIENDGAKYLVFDTAKINTTGFVPQITAFAVKEKDKDDDKEKDKDKKEKNETEDAEVNETTGNGTISNETLPEEGILNETVINETLENSTLINQTINDSINITPEINETIVPIINDSIQNATINITRQINKSITISLQYKNGTVYDEDNDGIEPITGIIDFTVEESAFSFDYDSSNLCTRWEVYSTEDSKSTTACYGSSECCALVNLEPSRESWNEPLYLSYNSLGAAYNNIVSAQVIYAGITNSSNDIVYSSWSNLSAKFEEIGLLKFENVCIDTCSLAGFNKSSYKIYVEVEKGKIVLDSINYAVRKIFANNPPELIKNFENYTVKQGSSLTINLSSYFYDKDDDVLSYNYYENDNFNISIDGNIAAITPSKNFSGVLYTFFTANDSGETAVSNVFSVNVTKGRELVQSRAEINKPVEWLRKILREDLAELKVSVPETAFNVSVESIENNVKTRLSNDKIKVNDKGGIRPLDNYELNKTIERLSKKLMKEKQKKKLNLEKITGLELELSLLLPVYAPEITEAPVVNETRLIIADNATEFELSFSTEAPEMIEEERDAYTKLVTISSELSYENVLAYTTIPEASQNAIKLFWIKNGTRELFTDVAYNDTNSNGLVDYIEWIVPHLSNQTFEVSITVLNIHSYPTLFGNWTVEFNTTGTGNLTISGFNGTTYAEKESDNPDTANDLDILELRCNNTILEPFYIVELDNLSLEGTEINEDAVKVITENVMSLEEKENKKSLNQAETVQPEVAINNNRYINVHYIKNSIIDNQNKEIKGSQNLEFEPEVSSRLNADEYRQLFKSFGLEEWITVGWQNLEMRSSIKRVGSRLSGFKTSTEVEVPALPSTNYGSNPITEKPINKDALNKKLNNEKTTLNLNNKKILGNIKDFFSIIPSAYALHIGSGSYSTISIGGKQYALLTKEQVQWHSYKIIGIYYENFNCDNRTAYHTVKELSTGQHFQMFNFSGQIAEAYNTVANSTCDQGDNLTECNITSQWGITNGSVLQYNVLRIKNGGALKNDTSTSSFKINASVIIIESGGYIRGNVNITAVNLTIIYNGSINASGLGFVGGKGDGSGPGGGRGGTEASTAAGGGGGYGSRGGNGTKTDTGVGGSSYGDIFSPVHLGSGGGGGAGGGGSTAGGNGSGAIFINVSNMLIVNGSILSNGGNSSDTACCGNGQGGGGSGGSIFIITNVFDGNGTINASGGSSWTGSPNSFPNVGGGGEGAGGRIAIYHRGMNSFTGSISALGGIGAYNASNGTNFTAGNITVFVALNQTTGVIAGQNITIYGNFSVSAYNLTNFTFSVYVGNVRYYINSSGALMNSTTVNEPKTNESSSIGNYGQFRFNITIPDSLPLGANTLTVNGTLHIISGTSSVNFTIPRAPIINTNFTFPTYPQFGRNVTILANVTDADDNVIYVNFTLTAPNGSVINLSNHSRYGDLYNTSFNLSSYGTWKWNVTSIDAGGNVINSTSTGIITLMQITENLNATPVPTSSPVAVSGHINLSNGSNVTNTRVLVFINEADANITSGLRGFNTNFTDTSQGDFTSGLNNLTNATVSPGNVTLANRTTGTALAYFTKGNFTSRIFNAGGTANWTNISFATEAHYQTEIGRATGDSNNSAQPFVNTSGLVLLLHFNNETRENDSLAKDFSVDVNPERAGQVHNNGSIISGAHYNFTDKKFGGGAMGFDGVDDSVSIANGASLNPPNDISVSAWFKTTDTTGGVVVKRSGNNGYRIILNGALYFTAGNGATIAQPNTGNLNGVNDGLWHHAVGTWSNSDSTARLYFDGVLRDSLSLSGPMTHTSTALLISDSDDSGLLSGTIDEVAIWNRTLSATEVKQLALRGHANLSLQTRGCANANCSDNPPFQGPNGTGSYFTNMSAVNYPNASSSRYFQYIAYLSTNNTNLTPVLMEVNVSYAGTFTDSLGNYNFTLTAPASTGNYTIKVNSTYADTIPGEQFAVLTVDATAPVVNTSVNNTAPRFGETINISANVTDNDALSIGQIIINQTGVNQFFNFSLSGISGTFSQNITISCTRGCVINLTARVNDTANNFRTNDTIITVANSVPVINTNFTFPAYPQFGRNVTILANVTDGDDEIIYVNFTLTAPNGSVINLSNHSRYGDLYNTSFNLSSYGTWKWNVTAIDADGNVINSTSSGQIILMQINLSLNVMTVPTSSLVAVSGHINLSNGSNVSNTGISIFVNEVLWNVTNPSNRNFTDTSDTDFTGGVQNSTNTSGTGIGANLTLAVNFTPVTTVINFTSSVNWTVPDDITSIEVLVVAGGGGGGMDRAGGGGAGGVNQTNLTVSEGTVYEAIVGAGGAGATSGNAHGANGSNSSIAGVVAVGGGGGAGGTKGVGHSGGSGGGGAWISDNNPSAGGSGTSGQGNAGGTGKGTTNNQQAGGGGGGNGSVGADATGGDGNTRAGDGGSGFDSGPFRGIGATLIAGGGGGGIGYIGLSVGTGQAGGGSGGKSIGEAGTSATANTGSGGGGGGSDGNGGNGGSGVVVVRYNASTYLNKGNFTSRALDASGIVNWTRISWNNETPKNTNITVYVRTSNDSVAYSPWQSQVQNSTLTQISTGRYLQYLVSLNTSNASLTPKIFDITLNYSGALTDSLGNYNFTLIAPYTTGDFSIKVNSTYADTIPGEQITTLTTVTRLPVINTNFTFPTYPQFGRNVTILANVTDSIDDVRFVNFTLTAPNGSIINLSNHSRYGDLYNTSFNLSSYGTWKWNVTAIDADGNVINSTSTGIITLMQVTENLNISTISPSSSVAVSGHINLSNGSNVSNARIISFIGDSALNISAYTIGLVTSAIENATNFNSGTAINITVNANNITLKINGSNQYPNQTGNFTSQIIDTASNSNFTFISWQQEVPYQTEIGRALGDINNGAVQNGFINTSGLVLLLHFNNETGENDSLAKEFSIDLNPERAGQVHNNGSIINGAHYNFTHKKFGVSSMSFDGGNDYVEVPDSNSVSMGNFNYTITAWVNLDDKSSDRMIAAKDTGGANREFYLYYYSTNDRFRINFVSLALGEMQDASFGSPNTGEWIFVAAWYDNTNKIVGLQIDNSVTNKSTTGTPSNTAAPVRIGQYQSNFFFDGDIDEVSIWNRTLSSYELQNLYRRGALRLNVSVRSCDDSACSGEAFSEVLNNASRINLNTSITPMNRYFQYRAVLNTEDVNLTPALYNVTINYTALVTDAYGNYNFTLIAPSSDGSYTIKVNSTYLDTIPGEQFVILTVDSTVPVVNTSVNNTAPRFGETINISANATDNNALSIGQIIINQTGAYQFFNFSLSGVSATFSQNITISCTRGCVINLTARVNDTVNNFRTNDTIITVANTPVSQAAIVFPGNDSKQRTIPLQLNVTFAADPDGDVINISYYINGRLNQTSLVNTTLNASDGVYVLNVSLFDNVSGASPSINTTINFTIDTVVPIANSSLNKSLSSIKGRDVINVSANATDEATELSLGQVIVNNTGIVRYFNFTLSGRSALVSQNITLNGVGVVNFTIRVNDSAGNVRTNDTIVAVTNTPPGGLSILLPSNNLYTSRQPLPLNVTFEVDAELDPITVYYYINGKLNQTSSTNTTFNASDGNYTLNVSLYDGIDFSGNSTINFTIDTVAPSAFNLTTPQNNTISGNLTTVFRWNVTNETNFANYTVEVSNGTNFETINYTAISLSRTENNASITLQTNKTWFWRVTAFDLAGNNFTTGYFNYTTNTILPAVNSSLNKTLVGIRFGDVINISANATDENGLSFGQVLVNISGFVRIFNFSLNGALSAGFSQNITVNATRGEVINFTVRVNDSAGNIRTNDTIVAVTNTPPGGLSILLPSNNLYTNQQPLPLNVTFAADADGDAVNISYYINGILNQTSLTNTTLNASDGVYILNVSLSDGISNSSNATVNFTIDIANASLRFVNVSPNPAEFGIDNITVNFTFSDTNPSTVRLNVTYPNGSVLGNFTTNFTLTIHNLTALGNYTVTLFVNDSSGNYNTTSTQVQIRDTTSPSVFELSSPADGTRSPNQTPTLDWQDTIEADLLNYTVELSTSSAFSFINRTLKANGSVTNSSVIITTPLNNNMNWSWRVKAYDRSNNSRTSTSAFRYETFENNLPAIPNLTSPTNNTEQLFNSINFTWTNSSDADGDALIYDLLVARDTAFTDIDFNVTGINATHFALNNGSALGRGTRYWQVRSYDSFNYSNYSSYKQLRSIVVILNITQPANNSVFYPGNSTTIAVLVLNGSDWVNNTFITLNNTNFTASNISGNWTINITFSSLTPRYLNITAYGYNLTSNLTSSVYITILLSKVNASPLIDYVCANQTYAVNNTNATLKFKATLETLINTTNLTLTLPSGVMINLTEMSVIKEDLTYTYLFNHTINETGNHTLSAIIKDIENNSIRRNFTFFVIAETKIINTSGINLTFIKIRDICSNDVIANGTPVSARLAENALVNVEIGTVEPLVTINDANLTNTSNLLNYSSLDRNISAPSGKRIVTEFEIKTNLSQFSNITIAYNYSSLVSALDNENNLAMYKCPSQSDCSASSWTLLTTSLNTTTNVISTTVTSLSVFLVAETATTTTTQTVTNTVTSSSSSSGGGGGSLVPQLVNLELIIPRPLKMYMNDSLTIPIVLWNRGEVDISNITISAAADASLLDVRLEQSSFDKILTNKSLTTNAVIRSFAPSPANSEIVFTATGTNPFARTTARLLINIIDRQEGNKSLVIEKVKLLADFFNSNTECLELIELLKRAQEASDKGESEKAIAITEAAINACRDILAYKGEKRTVVETPKKIARFRISVPLVITFALLATALLLYFARNVKIPKPKFSFKFRKSKKPKVAIGPSKEEENEIINRLFRERKK